MLNVLNADWLTLRKVRSTLLGKIVAGATIEGLVPATDERINRWKSIVALYFRVLVGQQPLP